MKYVLSISLICWAFIAKAQHINDKLLGGKNRFEFGNTLVNYFNKDGFNNYELNKFNLYWSYSRIIKNKHVININLTSYRSPYVSNANIGQIAGSEFESLNLGYGRILNTKKLEIIPQLSLSYRYNGGQSVVFAYRNQGSLFSEPLFAHLRYNSIGGIFAVDANYFLMKHIGIGLKFSYAFYPFENAKLAAGGVDQPDPAFVETHKPLNQMLIINGKLILRL
ncbi:MAG: hypothetical protein V4643_10145 [Bacteroidota bacterium]